MDAERLYAEVNGAPGGRSAGITMWTSRGQRLGFKIPPASKSSTIRVSVGEPGRRSTVWRIWANSNKADVYIGSRQTAHTLKTSLHESGDWRIQWIKAEDEHAQPMTPEKSLAVGGRVLEQWARPPAASNGWTDAISIWVPRSDLPEVPGDNVKTSDVQWIETPRRDEAVELRLFLVQPRHGPLDLTPALGAGNVAYVNGFRLSSGEAVVLFANTRPLDRIRNRALAKCRKNAAKSLPPGFDMDPVTGPRAMFVETEEDGRRSIWDLALQV